MGNMKEIFDAVSNDSNLQSKFKEVIRKSEGVGQEEAERNLRAFAKDAGFEVTTDDIVSFSKELTGTNAELSELELDMVAGGKSDIAKVIVSVLSFGINCDYPQRTSVFFKDGTGYCWDTGK